MPKANFSVIKTKNNMGIYDEDCTGSLVKVLTADSVNLCLQYANYSRSIVGT